MTEKKKKLCSSLRSWRLFCCLFSFVVRKVRDSAAQKLNRGRKRKRWGRGRGEKAVRKTSPASLFSILCFSSLVQLSLGLISYFTNHKLKEKIHKKKNCQLRGLVVQLLHLAGHCLRQPNKIVSKLVLWQLSVGRVSRGRQPIDSYIDNIKRDTSLHSISEIRSAMLDRNVWKDFVMKARSRDRPK